MVQLKILNKNNYEYILEALDGKHYNINLDFLDIKKEPNIGNYIFINEKLLNPSFEGYSTYYTFGSLENKYGRKITDLTDIDVIKVIIDEIEIYLKRLYG